MHNATLRITPWQTKNKLKHVPIQKLNVFILYSKHLRYSAHKSIKHVKLSSVPLHDQLVKKERKRKKEFKSLLFLSQGKQYLWSNVFQLISPKPQAVHPQKSHCKGKLA